MLFPAILVSFRPGRRRTRILLDAETSAELSAGLTKLLAAETTQVEIRDGQLTIWDHSAGPAAAAPATAKPPGPPQPAPVRAGQPRYRSVDEAMENITIGGLTHKLGWWLDLLDDFRTALMTYDQWLRFFGTTFGPWEVDDEAVRAGMAVEDRTAPQWDAKGALRALARARVTFAPEAELLRGRNAASPAV